MKKKSPFATVPPCNPGSFAVNEVFGKICLQNLAPLVFPLQKIVILNFIYPKYSNVRAHTAGKTVSMMY